MAELDQRVKMLESIIRGLRAALENEWSVVEERDRLLIRCQRLERELQFHQRYVRPPHDPKNPVPIANLKW